jgi:Homing endonuclease associated repeat
MSIKIDKAAVVAELQRVSQILGTKHLGYRDFEKLSTVGRSIVLNRFGSWNNALQEAGLFPAEPKRRNVPSDDELLIQIITLTERLQKIPSASDMAAHGDYSEKSYKTRWGSFRLAREAAYQKYGTRVSKKPIQARTSSSRQKQNERINQGLANNLKPHLLKINDDDTRAFVEEAIDCFEAGLYRSSVVMSWIGAISILYDYVIKNKLNEFNLESARRNSKWKDAQTKDDLSLMKESDFLDILVTLSIIGKNVKEQLKNNCLGLRNSCGHPNSFKVGRSMAESHLEMLLLNIYDIF